MHWTSNWLTGPVTARPMAQVLIMEGFDDVAKQAEAALQRLLNMPKYYGCAAKSFWLHVSWRPQTQTQGCGH